MQINKKITYGKGSDLK